MHHLAAGGEAGQDLTNAVFAEGAHAQFSGATAELGGREAGVDHAADFVVDLENFENPHSSPVAIAAALFAADRAEDRRATHAGGVERQGPHFLLGQLGGSLTNGAQFPHQSLGKHRPDGGGDEEWFHADVRKTSDRGRRVVGVERGENQVTGERGINGDVRRLRIPDFPDHDDVRRLPEHGSEGGCKGHADVCLHHDLVNTWKLVLDRVLDGNDLFVRLVDDVQTGVKRGRLARAGRTGDQQNPVWEAEKLLESLLII